MYPRQSVPRTVSDLAEAQSGVVTVEQCLGLGMTRSVIARLHEQRTWHRMARGIYLTWGPPAPWESLAWAGTLLGGDRAMLGGLAAGHLWGMTTAPHIIQVLVPQQRRTPDQSRWVFTRRRQLPVACGDPPRTPWADTVLDLCDQQPDRVATWIDTALHTRRGSVQGLLNALTTRPRQAHRALIATMIADHRDGIHSELERVFALDVERAHRLPTGRRQLRGARFRTDVDYGRLIVELDGRLGHEGRGRFRDMERDNHHLLAGKLTLRYGWEDCVQRPCVVARQVAAVLTNLGWAGPLATCPNCRDLDTVVGCAA